jgi:hypothetical protein
MKSFAMNEAKSKDLQLLGISLSKKALSLGRFLYERAWVK